MRAIARQIYRMFRRVRDFITANAPADALATLGKQLTELDDVLARLGQIAQDEEANRRLASAEIKRQEALREALRTNHMAPVSRVARDVFGTNPGVDRALRMPKKRADNEALVAAAGAMADAAAKQQQVFIDHALPPDFVQRLRDAAKALDTALGARVEATRRRVAATAALDAQLKRGRRAVRLLDAILAPKLAQDADRLAAWNSARKVNGVPGGRPSPVEEQPVEEEPVEPLKVA